MLSSAKKSVPTLKQFIQPYFIEIAPDGAITATCTRSVTILEKNNIYNHLGTTVPRSIDLSVNRPGSRSFLIRWTPTPANEPVEGGWQFAGVLPLIPFKNRRFLPLPALRRGDDFGMVPPNLRPPYWAGWASFLCARRLPRRRRGVTIRI